MRITHLSSTFVSISVLALAACVSPSDATMSDAGEPAANGDTSNAAANGGSAPASGSGAPASNGAPSGNDGTNGSGTGVVDAGSGSVDAGATTDAGTSPADASSPPVTATADPGPKPTASCPLTKDSAGFFTRTTTSAKYVGYVPASYDGQKPVRLVVALHGCGDSAYNFATWGANPYDTRGTQTHIGISVDGASAANGCWSMGGDDAKVLAAIDDAMSCFWIHKHEVVLAGFSSGGELAYRIALMNASRFSGLLIESSAAYASSNNEASLISGASWKLPIAHVQHSSDTVFPLASVQSDWARLTAAGFPLQTEVTAGGHDGTSTDWAGWLLPKAAGWVSP